MTTLIKCPFPPSHFSLYQNSDPVSFFSRHIFIFKFISLCYEFTADSVNKNISRTKKCEDNFGKDKKNILKMEKLKSVWNKRWIILLIVWYGNNLSKNGISNNLTNMECVWKSITSKILQEIYYILLSNRIVLNFYSNNKQNKIKNFYKFHKSHVSIQYSTLLLCWESIWRWINVCAIEFRWVLYFNWHFNNKRDTIKHL